METTQTFAVTTQAPSKTKIEQTKSVLTTLCRMGLIVDISVKIKKTRANLLIAVSGAEFS